MGSGMGVNVNTSSYNMGFGAGFDDRGPNVVTNDDSGDNNNNGNEIKTRINELQEKAKNGVERLIENKTYTVDNPSMGNQ